MAAAATTTTTDSKSAAPAVYDFKVGILGSVDVGKTSIVTRAKDEHATLYTQPTLGSDIDSTLLLLFVRGFMFLILFVAQRRTCCAEVQFGRAEGDASHFRFAFSTFCSPSVCCFFDVFLVCYADTSGQERFRSMTAQWVRNVDAYILVYALDNLSSAKDLTTWMEFIQEADPVRRSALPTAPPHSTAQHSTAQHSTAHHSTASTHFGFMYVSVTF
jgi:GTPase SAR1 family protein